MIAKSRIWRSSLIPCIPLPPKSEQDCFLICPINPDAISINKNIIWFFLCFKRLDFTLCYCYWFAIATLVVNAWVFTEKKMTVVPVNVLEICIILDWLLSCTYGKTILEVVNQGALYWNLEHFVDKLGTVLSVSNIGVTFFSFFGRNLKKKTSEISLGYNLTFCNVLLVQSK